MGRLYELEDRKAALQAQMAEAPADTPDVHPNIADLYRRKISRLAEALNGPADRDEASDARRGEVHAALTGSSGPSWTGWEPDTATRPKPELRACRYHWVRE